VGLRAEDERRCQGRSPRSPRAQDTRPPSPGRSSCVLGRHIKTRQGRATIGRGFSPLPVQARNLGRRHPCP
jgi:hypothetical protein